MLIELFDATVGEVGLVHAAYNASGFVASLVLPAYAECKADYLMIGVVGWTTRT